jgi:hypothetical protein
MEFRKFLSVVNYVAGHIGITGLASEFELLGIVEGRKKIVAERTRG